MKPPTAWTTGVEAPRTGESEALAVLACVDGLGPVTLTRLLDAFGGGRAVLEAASRPQAESVLVDASADAIGDGRRISMRLAGGIVRAASEEGRILAALGRAGLEVLSIGDPGYPPRLRSIALPPVVLFVRGDRDALSVAPSIAVVGTRRPTDIGRTTASRIAAALARAGATVVSGLAVGIDGAAHAAAVGERGLTVAVIGSGHDRLFPSVHRGLAAAVVAAGGAIVSEHPPWSIPTRGTFPRRNRIISGLAEAVVVVEAGARSGALITAAWALEQGRGCFLVPGPIDAPMSAGCLSFLRECHGEARIVAGVPQLLEDLGLAGALAGALAGWPGEPADGPWVAADAHSPPTTSPPPSARPRGPSPEAVLLELGPAVGLVGRAVAAGHATADELVAVSGLPIGAVLAAITVLETRGLVGGAYGRYHPLGALARALPGPAIPDPVPDGVRGRTVLP